MWKIDDFVCDDDMCDNRNVVVEVLYKKSQTVTCDQCNSPMTKQVSGIKSKHVSWSTWRVGMDG